MNKIEVRDVEYGDETVELVLPADGTWLAIQFVGVGEDGMYDSDISFQGWNKDDIPEGTLKKILLGLVRVFD